MSDLNGLDADIFRRLQNAPGLWTVNQLADATGEPVDAVRQAIHRLEAAKQIEPPTYGGLLASEVNSTVTYRPALTPETWIIPSKRPRPT